MSDTPEVEAEVVDDAEEADRELRDGVMGTRRHGKTAALYRAVGHIDAGALVVAHGDGVRQATPHPLDIIETTADEPERPKLGSGT